MRRVTTGVTRTVYVGRRWAFKVPRLDLAGLRPGQHRVGLVRGWLANRSEWRQRHRPDVARPVATLGHLVLVMPAADHVPPNDSPPPCAPAWWPGESADEAKGSSWGLFGTEWKLIDFDRAWTEHDRGLVGRLYYAGQARKGRRWARLQRET